MDTTSTQIYMIWYRIEMQMEARILLEMRLCIHWLTLNCNIFLFFFLQFINTQETVHTHTHISFDHITLLFYPVAWLMLPFLTHGHQFICLPSCFFITTNSSLPEDLSISLFFWPGIFFSLIFSNYNVPPTIYIELYFITAEFYTRNVIVFSIPILYYKLMVVISLSIPLPDCHFQTV